MLEAPGKLVEREGPRPVISTGCAVVRMERVGVCGSDFHAFAGSHPIYSYPRVLGHELSGVIVECPPNFKGLQPGDRCAIEPYNICGTCRACLKGRYNCCESIQLFGVHIDGGLQEYLVVPLALLHKSESLSLDQLALVETLGIGAHAVNRSKLEPGAYALVIGAGPVGIAVALFARVTGANVHIVEKIPERRHVVERMGYSATQAAEERQADVVFDATGSAGAMAKSISLVAPAGVLVYVGLTKDPVCIDDSEFHRKEITLMASRNSFGSFPRIIRLIEEGNIDVAHWVTDRVPFSEVVSQFPSLRTRPQLVKAIIEVSHGD